MTASQGRRRGRLVASPAPAPPLTVGGAAFVRAWAQLTPTRRRVLEATMHRYIAVASYKVAAHDLGVSPSTVKRRVAVYCAAVGVTAPIQAAFFLGHSGPVAADLEPE